jgi:phospholipase C
MASDIRRETSAITCWFSRFTLMLAAVVILVSWNTASASIAISPLCALNPANRTVTICTPGTSAILSLPVHVVAGTKDSSPVTSMQVLLDGSSVYSASGSTVDIYLHTISAGAHTIVVTASDSAGSFSQTLPITITNHAGITNIRHIIFLVQENHSFDNYFGVLGQYKASQGYQNDVDGMPLNVVLLNTQGQPVSPFHTKTECIHTLSPIWDHIYLSVDGGKMDKFMNSSGYVPADPTVTRAMGYYDQTDLPYYYEAATQFATSDRFFSPVLSQTLPNRMYLFAATSFGHIRPDPPPSGGWTQPTIFDHMDQAGVSWRYYYQNNNYYLPQWSTYQRDAAKLKPIANWYTDIQNEPSLPSVIFIERGGGTGIDEHPGTQIQKGAATVANIVNHLMSSPSWSSSVFILTYDEGGGEYDHVIPATNVAPDSIPPMLKPGDAQGDFMHDGQRVPMIVFSPWTRPHFVSHTWRDYTSILRLIEDRFNVPSLSARDAAADNMMEFFNFSSPAWMTPPKLPTQPTNGVCNYNLERAPGY